MTGPTLPQDDALALLHISDVHFGVLDSRGEKKRITDALIAALHQQPIVPQVLIFSGDLANSGQEQQFSDGFEWLSKIVSPWPDCRLFVVPGNHDVDRGPSNLILRQIHNDENKYTKDRSNLQSKMQHLAAFFAEHARAKKKFGARLLSDWSSPFGCHAKFVSGGRPIHLIGLNTAILSCGDDDYGHLVQDVRSLNEGLGRRTDENDCVIAIGHHPLSWLADWNGTEVRRLLCQQIGANVYLHGHRHVQSASTSASSLGDNLATLECGAAYDREGYSNYFAFYRLDFSRREIQQSVYALSVSSGGWIKSDGLAQPLLAPLPPPRPSISIQEPIDRLELDLRRLLERTVPVFAWVSSIHPISSSLKMYRFESRLKSIESCIKKIQKRQERGDHSYGADDIEDICGFRYVTTYYSDIPMLIDIIIDNYYGTSSDLGSFIVNEYCKLTIHTSRPLNDPLSITPRIEKIVKKWGPRVRLDPIVNRPTGYSSVHIIFWISDTSVSPKRLVPVEFQVRSGLEEFWGQLDHKLRYSSARGIVGDNSWQKHLNVLKAQFDAMVQYVDLIRESADADIAATSETTAGTPTSSTVSLSTPAEQLEGLRGLPSHIYAQVEEAFELWKQADASRQFGGQQSKFRIAADAFKPFINVTRADNLDEHLARKLSNVAQHERAYMLMLTYDPECVDEARRTYENTLRLSPEDPILLFRLGQVLLEQCHLDEAITRFDESIEFLGKILSADSTEGTKRLYDSARNSRGLAFFRIYEERGASFERRAFAIKEAFKQAKDVRASARDETAKRQALNDMIYYAWEERGFFAHCPERLSLSEEEFSADAKALIIAHTEMAGLSFREHDTLVRIQLSLNDKEAAIRSAQQVCLLLERAARERGWAVASATDRFGQRWLLTVLPGLVNDDERDALLFSAKLLDSNPFS